MYRMRLLSLAMVLALIVSGTGSVALAQTSTPTIAVGTTPVAPQTSMATPSASTDAGMAHTGDAFPMASATTRQAFDLLGARVENMDGDAIGEIDNLLVVPSTGQIPYALVAVGGFLGLGENLTVIPFDALRFDTERDVFILDVTEEAMNNAPTLNRYASPDTRALNRDPEFQNFWGQFHAADASSMNDNTVTSAPAGVSAVGTPVVPAPRTVNATPGSNPVASGSAITNTAGTASPVTPAPESMNDSPMGRTVQVGGLGERLTDAQSAEGLVRLTQLGGFRIVLNDARTMRDNDVTQNTAPTVAAPYRDTGTALPMTTPSLNSGSVMTDTQSAAPTAMPTAVTTTAPATGAMGQPEVQIGAMRDVVIDVEAARLMYVVALLDRAMIEGAYPGAYGTLGAPGVGATGVYSQTTPDLVGTPVTTAPVTTAPGTVGSTGVVTDTTAPGMTQPGTAPGLGQAGVATFDRILIPWQAFEVDVVDQVLRLNVDLDQIVKAPLMQQRNLDFTTPNWDEPYHGYWVTVFGAPTADADTAPATTTQTTPRARSRNLTTQAGVVMQAEQIVGTEVINNVGDELGEIGALLISSGEGKVAYGVLSYGGFLGLGEKQVAIPWSAYRYNPAETNFVVNITADELDAAPELTSLDPETIGAPGWDAEVQDFWSARGEATPAVSGTGVSPVVTPQANTTGAMSHMGLLRLNRIIGADVMGRNDVVAEVDDLLIQVETGQVLHLIVSYGGGFLGLGKASVPVPWRAVKVTADENDNISISLDADSARLDNAPQLNLNPLPESIDANWDAQIQRYWGVSNR